MILLVSFVLGLAAIGIVIVVRSGMRQITLDEQDRRLAEIVQEEKDRLLSRPAAPPPRQAEESWTLDSAEDTGDTEKSE